MTRMVRFYPAIFGLHFFLLSGATLTFAQVDPAKALVGRWEGQVQVAKQMERTLTINSVKAKGEGEWVARGRYAITGMESEETTGGQAMSVSLINNEIYLEFITGNARNPVKLKLIGENKLEGTTDFGGKVRERKTVLEKVAPKAGDVK